MEDQQTLSLLSQDVATLSDSIEPSSHRGTYYSTNNASYPSQSSSTTSSGMNATPQSQRSYQPSRAEVQLADSRLYFLQLLNFSSPSNTDAAGEHNIELVEGAQQGEGVLDCVPFSALNLDTLVAGYRAHTCPVCSKFVKGDRQDFRRHYMTHTGEKPCRCPLCSYKTIRKSDMNKHIRSKHGDGALNA